jgi:hypothetical protein
VKERGHGAGHDVEHVVRSQRGEQRRNIGRLAA